MFGIDALQYLEDNVHQTYVDVGVMAQYLQQKHREYTRRKSGPFQQLVDQGTNITEYCFIIKAIYLTILI